MGAQPFTRADQPRASWCRLERPGGGERDALGLAAPAIALFRLNNAIAGE